MPTGERKIEDSLGRGAMESPSDFERETTARAFDY
jgi:hypothetical protein